MKGLFSKRIFAIKMEHNKKCIQKGEEYYEEAPKCKYPNGGCICKRQLNTGPCKCYYIKGPDKCCFEKEVPKKVLEISK